MRIICPSCDAQYEVPDEVIPEDGRDVQCSNCGKTWFQAHPDFPDAKGPEPERTEDVIGEPEPVDDSPAEDEDYAEAPVQAPSRREMDPTVADILRQEAERETSARAAENKGESLEIQPDLGLAEVEDSADRRAREARDRMARIRGEAAAPAPSAATPEPSVPETPEEPSPPGNIGEAAATAAAVGSRRDLLPDIEEINSTLRSTSDRDLGGDDLSPEAPIRTRKRRSFRRGFLFALVLFVIAVLIYTFAPDIAQTVPQADPWLTSYVTWVDGMRASLDVQLQQMLQWLDAMAAESGSS